MFELMEELDGCAEEGSGCTKEVTHNVVVDQANNLLSQILDDPFLSDLPKDCNLETAKAELSLYQGKAITIHIHRYDGQTISVIVLQGATVQDLMQTFENKVEENCKKQALTTHLSWKYVWSNYWLVCGQTILEDYKAKLSSYGISNQSSLHFTKKLKKKL